MKICSKCKQTLPTEMFTRDRTKSSGYRSYCKVCSRKISADYYIRNIDKIKDRKNSQKDKIKESAADYYQRNKSKVASNTRKRQASKLKCTPKWLTESELNEIFKLYETARLMTIQQGIPYEVDHIVPLQNDMVCGLHVPWNLQILTRKENRSKANKLLQ